MFYKCYSSWRFPQNDSYQKFGFKRNQLFFVTWLDFFVSVRILYHLPFLVGGPQGQNSAHFYFLLRWHFFMPQTLSKACKRFVTSINRQLHFSPFSKAWIKPITLATFSKLTSFTKKWFSSKPFAPHSINVQLNEN